jgi:hypothetical protein
MESKRIQIKNKKKGINDENEKKIKMVYCDNVSTSNFLIFLLSVCEFVCIDNKMTIWLIGWAPN